MVFLVDYNASNGSSGKNDNNQQGAPLPAAAPFPLQGPPTPPPPPRGGRSPDTCFTCKRVGHWSRDCPSKTPKLAPSSTPSSSSTMEPSQILPVIRCPCGAGACRVLTSHTQKNPNRQFYTCPIRDQSLVKCGFFKWCDEVMQYTIPACTCGAGVSSINLERESDSSVPSHAARWFFACRVKKNHGACQFYQPVDPQLNFLLNKNLHRVEGHPSYSPPTKQHTSKQLLISDLMDMSPEMEVSEIPSNSINPQNSADNDEVPNQDVVVKETDSWVPVIGEGCQIRRLPFQSDIKLLQRKFLRQISAAGNSSAGERVYQFFDVQFHGWMGRLVFPPCHSLNDPPALSIFWCVFPHCYPIPTLENAILSDVQSLVTPLGNESEVAAMHAPVEHSPEQNDEPLSNTWCDAPSTETSSTVAQVDSFSSMILKSLGGGLVKILESMRVSEHKKMLKVAESTFESFRSMEVDCEAFCEGVKEYINCQSRLVSMGDALCKDLSAEQLIDKYYSKKAHFDHVSQLHNEAVSAFQVSNARVHNLCEEASILRDTLTQLEKQISDRKSETLKLQSGVDEIYAKKIEAEMHMEAASLAMEEALELEKQIDLVNATAKATMEKLQSLIK